MPKFPAHRKWRSPESEDSRAQIIENLSFNKRSIWEVQKELGLSLSEPLWRWQGCAGGGWEGGLQEGAL